MKLEADEGHLNDESTDLEFVTDPASDWVSASSYLAMAANMAKVLARRADPVTSIVLVKAGRDDELNGEWTRDFAISVSDPLFRAAVQGTVGVPLARLTDFIKTTFARISAGDQTAAQEWQEIERRTVKSIGGAQVSDGLRGFLAACHMFLLRATTPPLSNQQWVMHWQTGLPEGSQLFDFTGDNYIAGLGDFDFPEARNWIIVPADGPKVLFPLLHRTDFFHMFRSLSDRDQLFVRTAWQHGDLWTGDPAQTYLFPYPYRGEVEALDVNVRAPHLWKRATPVGEDAPEWLLLTHGPTVAQWWDSAMNGDPMRNRLAKDNASPPPGWRGRRPDRINDFPRDQDEDKSTYYGMGAFPMDPSADPPLAVFEHRFLIADQAMLDDRYPSAEKWVDVGKIFYDNYVPK
jgi:hypothetical protein